MSTTVETSTGVGIDGSSYTSAVSNDTLSNEDFLTLMLEELKMQDPTDPTDTSSMLDSQMQMSTMETNLALAESMATLATAFTQSSLSSASSLIGQGIEDGNTNALGINSAYTVRSVASEDGEIMITAQEILFLEDGMQDADGNAIEYNTLGEILDADGNTTGEKVTLNYTGNIATDENGLPIILDEDNAVIEDSGYELSGTLTTVYSDELTTIPFSSITKVF